MERIKVAVFGYNDGYPSLERVVASEQDEIIWHFDFDRADEALDQMMARPPEVLVVNPLCRSFLPWFKLVMPPYVKVILSTHPFGCGGVNLHLAV